MKKGYLPFYLIYQEPFLVSQSFFVFTPENFEQYLFFINYFKKETLGLLNNRLDEIREQRNHHSL